MRKEDQDKKGRSGEEHTHCRRAKSSTLLDRELLFLVCAIERALDRIALNMAVTIE